MTGSTLDRAFAALELLASAPAGLPLGAIARALALPKSGTHRLLAALAGRGYVSQDADSGRYRLTTRLAALGFRHLAAAGIVDLVQPVLDRLAEATGELVRLGVVDGDAQTWVAKAQGARSGLRYDPDMGSEAPLAPTASGQAWLAALDDEQALALVARQGFPGPDPRGPNAPRTLKALLERLEETRRRGYACVVESSAPGTSAMAAAIRHPATGGVVGTVSVAGPSIRLTEARMRDLAPALLAGAAELADASAASPFFAAASRASPRPTARVAAERTP